MADTEGARTDLRFARKYLENKQFNEARDYIASARGKDPDVTLAVKTESKTVATLTPNLLEADILEQQSLSYVEQINTLKAEHEKYRAETLKVLHRNLEKLQKLDDPKAHEEEYNRQAIERKYDDQVSSQRYEEFHGRIDYLRGEIVKCLEQAIKLNPQNPDLYAFLGRTYFDQKHVDNAVELLRMAQEHWPEHFEIRRTLDSALKEQELQQQLKTAPTTYHPSASHKPANVFAISLILALASLAFAVWAGYVGSNSPRPPPNSPMDIFLAAGILARFVFIICATIAFFNRPRMPQDYYDQLNR